MLPGGAALEPSCVSPFMSERHTGEHSVGHFSSRGMPHSLGYCYQSVRSVDEEGRVAKTWPHSRERWQCSQTEGQAAEEDTMGAVWDSVRQQ